MSFKRFQQLIRRYCRVNGVHKAPFFREGSKGVFIAIIGDLQLYGNPVTGTVSRRVDERTWLKPVRIA